MHLSRSVGLRNVALSLSAAVLLWSAPIRAEDLPAELPPPPPLEGADTAPPESSAGAELPPLPEAPTSTAEAPMEDLDSTSVETPPGEEVPELPMSTDQAENEVPADSGLTDVASDAAPAPMMSMSSGGSSSEDLSNVSMSDRIKSKDLVLWLSLGPSYGTLTTKGTYTVSSVAGASDAVGGLGYNAGIGFMVDDFLQMQFDFTGTPKTKDSTVDSAMFGIGPRLGFLYFMGEFGVQQGPVPGVAGSVDKIFAIGARAGLDLVLKHSKDSRVSIGLSPEVYYITPQGADGYNSMGMTVSLRLYGYDSAF